MLAATDLFYTTIVASKPVLLVSTAITKLLNAKLAPMIATNVAFLETVLLAIKRISEN